jgi:Kef-type K+ transport system membrane component KefB
MAFEQFTGNLIRVLNLEIVNILILLIVVWLVGEMFKRIKLPAVLGELLAGLIIGPPMLNLIGPSDGLNLLAKLGMFFLMFYAGLQTDPKKLFKRRRSAMYIGVIGTVVPFVMGLFAMVAFGGTWLQGVFVGAAISGTSMVTKARILGDLKILNKKLGHTIMGSTMIDNMFSFIVLAVAIKSILAGEFTFWGTLFTLVEATLFFTLSLYIGYKIYPYITDYMRETTARGFTFALIVGLFFAFFAEMMSIHFIIGAYLAGLMVREEIAGPTLFRRLKERFMVITDGFLGPLFIVSVAFNVSFSSLGDNLWLLLVVFLAAFAGKIIGSGIGAWYSGAKPKDALTIGLAMNGRGTVELVLAAVGLELGILNQSHLTILVFVAFITTLIVPFALKFMLNHTSNHLLKD